MGRRLMALRHGYKSTAAGEEETMQREAEESDDEGNDENGEDEDNDDEPHYRRPGVCVGRSRGGTERGKVGKREPEQQGENDERFVI